MENSLIELRSKSAISKVLGTWVIRVTKEGVEYFAEGIVTALGNKNTFIPWENISSVEVKTILFQTNFKVFTTSGKTYEVINVEKIVAIEAKELMLQLQQEHQKKNTSSNNNQPQESSNSTIDVADQLEKLSNLKDKGILTQAEFDIQKQKLLGM
jgi:membrane carboxypeptidase/penicillin-binding protein